MAPESYETWLALVPAEITNDSLWKMKAYRLSLFAADLGWSDVTKLMRDKRTQDLANQLYRALGSIGANLAEGYSRGTGKDRARFYEYVLGSARECRTWYFNGRHVLGEAVTSNRLKLLTEIIRLILAMVPQQRGGMIREKHATYRSSPNRVQAELSLNREELETLLQHIPYPD